MLDRWRPSTRPLKVRTRPSKGLSNSFSGAGTSARNTSAPPTKMPQIDPPTPGHGALPNGIELIVLGLEVSPIGLLGQMRAVQRQVVVQHHQNGNQQHLRM